MVVCFFSALALRTPKVVERDMTAGNGCDHCGYHFSSLIKILHSIEWHFIAIEMVIRFYFTQPAQPASSVECFESENRIR